MSKRKRTLRSVPEKAANFVDNWFSPEIPDRDYIAALGPMPGPFGLEALFDPASNLTFRDIAKRIVSYPSKIVMPGIFLYGIAAGFLATLPIAAVRSILKDNPANVYLAWAALEILPRGQQLNPGNAQSLAAKALTFRALRRIAAVTFQRQALAKRKNYTNILKRVGLNDLDEFYEDILPRDFQLVFQEICQRNGPASLAVKLLGLGVLGLSSSRLFCKSFSKMWPLLKHVSSSTSAQDIDDAVTHKPESHSYWPELTAENLEKIFPLDSYRKGMKAMWSNHLDDVPSFAVCLANWLYYNHTITQGTFYLSGNTLGDRTDDPAKRDKIARAWIGALDDEFCGEILLHKDPEVTRAALYSAGDALGAYGQNDPVKGARIAKSQLDALRDGRGDDVAENSKTHIELAHEMLNALLDRANIPENHPGIRRKHRELKKVEKRILSGYGSQRAPGFHILGEQLATADFETLNTNHPEGFGETPEFQAYVSPHLLVETEHFVKGLKGGLLSIDTACPGQSHRLLWDGTRDYFDVAERFRIVSQNNSYFWARPIRQDLRKAEKSRPPAVH